MRVLKCLRNIEIIRKKHEMAELYEVVAEILVFVDDMDRMKGKLKESGLL